MTDKTTTAISGLGQDLTQPGFDLPANLMPKPEVALRLAGFILALPGSGAMASVAVERTGIKVGDVVVLDIGRFMAGTGWEQVREPQVGQSLVQTRRLCPTLIPTAL
jgi:hypothetical protein